MEFIKKHYEKIILGLVLLILGAAAAYLPFALTKEKADLDLITTKEPPHKEYQAMDLSTQQLAIAQLQEGKPVIFPERHNLFNPVTWKQKVDGSIPVKIDGDDKEGIGATKIVEIRPLYLIVTLDRTAGGGFYLGVLKETVHIRKTQKYAKIGDKIELSKTEILTIREVKGAIEDPSDLVAELDLNGAKETVTISNNKPFKRAEGFAADLKYDLENKTFPNKRIGDVLLFPNENYKIIDIKQNEVTVRALSNYKMTTIRWNVVP